MAQTELEQIAMAMMMMAEDPERRRRVLQQQPSTTAAVLSPGEYREATHTGSSISEGTVQKEGDEEFSDEDDESLEKEDGQEGNTNNNNNYSINPNSLSTPSPAGSLKSNESSSSTGGTGCGGGANSTTRRIFTPEFKQSVLDSFTNDPACIGNQRATARKFNIHRRQVQKWLQQLTGQPSSDNNKDQQQPSSDEQEQKVKKSDKDLTPNPPSSSSSSVSLPSRRSILAGKCTTTNPKAKSRSNRPRAKMPIVAGKGPLIPLQASAVSSSPSASLPSSSPLMSINGKGLGNIHHPLFSNNNSNLFMGLASPLLSSLPLALEACNSRHVSPPPMQSPSSNGVGHVNGGRHSAGHNHNNGNNNNIKGNLSAQRMLELVDELCYLYPSEDFSLLRRAMLKNEVSFTKLSPPLRKHRKNSSSPSPGGNDYITQQTLQMIKNQNEYLQLLQSGYANLSQFQDLSDHSNNGKYASWLNNPFAAAAAVGAYNLQGGNATATSKHGNGLDTNRKQQRGNNNNTNINGNGNNSNHHHDVSASQQHHNFASPKAPVSNNSKSKTVAAVLASQRNGPTSQRLPNSSYDKTKRPSQNRRKMTNGRPVKSFPTPPNNNDDDYLDPTSMLEVVTSKPSPMDNMESYGMDLSTTKANNSIIQRSPSLITTSTTIRSKAMNKDYGFLSELGLVRKQQETNLTNGYTSPPPLSSTASLEHFVDNVLSMRRSSPHTSSSGSPPGHELNYATNNNNNFESSDRSKDSVLEAFNYDPELAGDARGVARKFGLNIRVVQKWIREAPTRSIQINNNDHGENGDDAQFDDEDNENFPLQHQHLYQQRSVIASTSTHSVNKRKNPKPNQICDFTEDDLDENGALDMVVPIKKRRVSTPPTPTTA